jgi:hypothetical protein
MFHSRGEPRNPCETWRDDEKRQLPQEVFLDTTNPGLTKLWSQGLLSDRHGQGRDDPGELKRGREGTKAQTIRTRALVAGDRKALTRMMGQKLIFQALMMAARESAPLMTAMAATGDETEVHEYNGTKLSGSVFPIRTVN